jgi:methylenetetrahydrofolate dehydrogenase (NADP+)/methenyltetrahydrofolate cyclohydrolase
MKDKILNGKETSDWIINDIQSEIQNIKKSKGILNSPTLGVILVGNNPAHQSYVKNKVKACQKSGINHQLLKLDESISESQLIESIQSFNNDPFITGFIVQLPLPQHINVNKVLQMINPDKDVDGFHPVNFGKTALVPSLKPATPYGILKLIRHNKIETKGKHVVVVGRSNIVGKPFLLCWVMILK